MTEILVRSEHLPNEHATRVTLHHPEVGTLTIVTLSRGAQAFIFGKESNRTTLRGGPTSTRDVDDPRRMALIAQALGADQKVCRSCNAPIFWALTNEGRKMPIDSEPVETGHLVLVGGGVVQVTNGDTVHAVDGVRKLHETELRYDSHFATCPHAERHRRRTGS